MDEILKLKDESNLECLTRLYKMRKEDLEPEKLDKVLDLIEKVEGDLTKAERKALNKAMGRKEKWTLQDKLKLFEIGATIFGALLGGASAIVNHEKNKIEKYRIDSANRNLDRLAEFEQEGSIRTFVGRESAKEATRK